MNRALITGVAVGVAVGHVVYRYLMSRNSKNGTDEIGFLSDLEGNWDFFVRCAQSSRVLEVTKDKNGEPRIALRPGKMFVFGGDAVDKGPGDRKVVQALLSLKEENPDRVFLIGGNRDYNKMRYTSELDDIEIESVAVKKENDPEPYWVPVERRVSYKQWMAKTYGDKAKNMPHSKVTHVKFMLSATMGCNELFEFRRQELGGSGVSDEAVADSFTDSVSPDGWMTRYMKQTQIAFLHEDVLFIHGGFNVNNYGRVPGLKNRLPVQEWVSEINAWCHTQVREWDENRLWRQSDGRESPENNRPHDGRMRGGDDLLDYVCENGMAKKTVIYATFYGGKNDMPQQMEPEVIRWLKDGGVRMVVVGHKPHGDCPTAVQQKDPTIYTISADTMYATGRFPPDNRGDSFFEVVLKPASEKGRVVAEVSGMNTHKEVYSYQIGGASGDPYVGRPTRDGAQWVKCKLRDRAANGDPLYVLSHNEGFKVITKTVPLSELKSLL